MAKRKGPSAIGLSMLDLISNSLASVIILFIIISSLRKPSIPPERIKGTLLVRFELLPQQNLVYSESIVWVEPPNISQGDKHKFFGNEIFMINKDDAVFGLCQDCKEKKFPSNMEQFITPCIAVYSPLDSNNVHYIVIRDPPRNGQEEVDWKMGILYVDHDEYDVRQQPATATIQAWFIDNVNQDIHLLKDSILDAPSNSKGFSFNLDRLGKIN